MVYACAVGDDIHLFLPIPLPRVSYRGPLSSQLSKLQGQAGPGQVVMSRPAAEQLAHLLSRAPGGHPLSLTLLPGEQDEDEGQEVMAGKTLVVKPLGHSARSKGVYQCCLVSTESAAPHAESTGHVVACSRQPSLQAAAFGNTMPELSVNGN
jgi:hypothetical protein